MNDAGNAIKPWSCDSWRRIRGDGEVGLGGIVVMTGAPHITAEAGMCVLSCSILGLDGSSEDRKTAAVNSPISIEPLSCSNLKAASFYGFSKMENV